MVTLNLTCEILTPMFLGGPIPGEVEFRPPSIKGALRFWWRAANGVLPLEALRIKEAELFGSADANYGKSSVKIGINSAPNPSNSIFSSFHRSTPNELNYLIYGAEDRKFFLPGSYFSFKLLLEDEGDRIPILESLSLMATFGGLGSKARNGFGRFAISECNFEVPEPGEIIEKLKKASPISAYSSISVNSQCFSLDIASGEKAWESLLQDFGVRYKAARKKLTEHRKKFIALPFGEDKELRLPKSVFVGIKKGNNETLESSLLYLPFNYLENNEEYGQLKYKRGSGSVSQNDFDGAYKTLLDEIKNYKYR